MMMRGGVDGGEREVVLRGGVDGGPTTFDD